MSAVAYTLDDLPAVQPRSQNRVSVQEATEKFVQENRKGVVGSFLSERKRAERRERWKSVIEQNEFYKHEEIRAIRDRRVIAEMLLENQAQHCDAVAKNPDLMTWSPFVKLPSPESDGAMTYVAGQAPPKFHLAEQTTSANIASFPHWALPLAYRAQERLFVDDVVTTMPMDCCEGYLAFVDAQFCSTGQTYSSGTRIDNVIDPDYSDCPAECTTKNAICADMHRYTITCECKALYYGLSIQAQQDAECYWGLAIGDFLHEQAGLQIKREWQRLIIEDLRTLGTAGNVNFPGTQPAAAPWNVLPPAAYYHTMFTMPNGVMVIDANIFAAIYTKSNFLIMDEDTAAIAESAESYSQDPIGDWYGHTSVATTPNLFGSFAQRWNVYVDPFLVANTIIVGTKGSTWAETNYVNLPWIEAYSSPMFYDPRTNCMYRSIMKRGARYMIRPEAFGTVTII